MDSGFRRQHWADGAVVTAVALLLLAYGLLVMMSHTGGEVGPPLDDAWIHYQFARNLSQGNGFSYNPGIATPGSTAPLWTVMLAPIGWFTNDFVVPSLVLSALFGVAAAWLAAGLTRELTGARWASLLAGLGTVAAGRMLWAGLAGMETTAFAAVSLAAVWAYVRGGLRPLPVLLFALAAQLRPEGHALFMLAILDSTAACLVGQCFWRSWLREMAVAFVIYGLVALPYIIFSLATTGHPLPNTFYAKAGTTTLFSWRTLRETIGYHWRDNPVSLLLLLPAVVPLWRSGRLLLLWLVGLPLFTAVIIDFTWHHSRYTMPLIPFQIVAATIGAYWLVNRLAPHRQRLGVTVLTLLILGAGLWGVPGWAGMLGNNAREIIDIDVTMGQWLAANTPPDAVIAVDDIGAIAFLSGRRIIDMNGLVSPEVWPAVRQPNRVSRSQMLARILSQSKPAYMVAFPLWRWEIATNPLVARELHRVSTPTHTIIFQQDAYAYQMTWPFVDVADPQLDVDVMFGDGIRLLGVDTAVTGDVLALNLYWQSEQVVAADYDVFVHVVNGDGDILAQSDQQPVAGLAATSIWEPGDLIRDPVNVLLYPEAEAIRVGLYLRMTGERLPVYQNGTLIGDAILIELEGQP